MAFDAFLKFGDGSKVKGEAQDARHPDEVQLLSFRLTASNPSTAGGAAAASAQGRVKFSTFDVRKKVDKASAALLQACAAGDKFDRATVTVRKAGGRAALEYLVYTFEQVCVDEVTTGGEAATSDEVTEDVRLSFASVHLKYTPQRADGAGDSPIEGGWDLTRNRPK
jgi:type VI secretion system secreted protein Hcp